METAEKRLAAIKEYSDLGSGFKIAMRDLEIRGAGNLLGAEQSGHMAAVGYDLYCKMLHEAVKDVKGETKTLERFDTSIDIGIDAFIPPSYIANEFQKLDIYKRIAGIENADEAVKEIEKMCHRHNSTLMAIENGERFGWLTSDGWKELKLNRITEHGLVEAVSGDTLITIQPGALVLYKDTEEFKETLEFAKKITGKGRMITCEEYDEMHNKFTKLQVEKDKKLEAIKNGANFGILSGWGDGEYYPLVYKETLDEKNGLIRAYEESVRKVHYEYVVNLYVEGYSE